MCLAEAIGNKQSVFQVELVTSGLPLIVFQINRIGC